MQVSMASPGMLVKLHRHSRSSVAESPMGLTPIQAMATLLARSKARCQAIPKSFRTPALVE
jgi:hypothetical protein